MGLLCKCAGGRVLKTLARVLPVLSAIACGILVYFGSLHIDPRGLSIETSFEHVLVSLFAMLIVMITVGQIVSGHESTWRLLDQAQESSNAILAAFAIVFGLNLRAYVEVTLGGIEFILALIYISLDFDASSHGVVCRKPDLPAVPGFAWWRRGGCRGSDDP